MSITLRVTGRAFPSEWHEKTYTVMAEKDFGDGKVGTAVFGYVHRAQDHGRAWIVRTEDGKVWISPVSSVNTSREAALWLAERKLSEP